MKKVLYVNMFLITFTASCKIIYLVLIPRKSLKSGHVLFSTLKMPTYCTYSITLAYWGADIKANWFSFFVIYFCYWFIRYFKMWVIAVQFTIVTAPMNLLFITNWCIHFCTAKYHYWKRHACSIYSCQWSLLHWNYAFGDISKKNSLKFPASNCLCL